MTTYIETLKAAGFKPVKVTAEQYEDGVGTTVGTNWVKGQVFYTQNQALRELGIIVKATTTERKSLDIALSSDHPMYTLVTALRTGNDRLAHPDETRQVMEWGQAQAEAWATEQGMALVNSKTYFGVYESGEPYVTLDMTVTYEYEVN